MPLHPGSWQASPGPMVSTPNNAASAVTGAFQSSDFDWATLCETSTTGVVGPAFTAGVAAFPSGGYQLTQGQAEWTLTAAVDQLLLGVFTPPLPWPANAVDWEWDLSGEPAGHGRISLVTSIDITATLTDPGSFSTPTDLTVDMVPIPPVDLTYFPFGDPNYPLAESHPTPGAALAPIIGSTAMPAGTTTGTLTATLTDFSYLSGLTDPNAEVVLVTVLAPDAQRTHTAPPALTDRSIAASDLHLVFHFTPPRWRFLFSVLPPLRQFPRDDNLGGAPRQGQTNGATSVQGSARQGWRATYR